MADLDQFLEHEAVELVPIGKITSDRYSRIAASSDNKGLQCQPMTSGSARKQLNRERN